MYKESNDMERIRRSIGEELTEVIFGKDGSLSTFEDDEEEDGIQLENHMLEILVHKHVREGKINDAENILFEELEEQPTKRNLKFALSFYEQLMQFDEETLEGYDYSKEEIDDGLAWIKQVYTKEYATELAALRAIEGQTSNA